MTTLKTMNENGYTFVDRTPLGFEVWGENFSKGDERFNKENGDGCILCGRPTKDTDKWVSIDESNGGWVAVVTEDTEEAREGGENCQPMGSTCHKKLSKALATEGLFLL